MSIKAQFETNAEGKALVFPAYVGGIGFKKLVEAIEAALGVDASRPIGSPLEQLIQFNGYPDQFSLWWDGFTCELGCSGPCNIDMDVIARKLAASGKFEIASA